MERGAALAEDTTRMGDYVVLKRVAIGGMAEIFLARKDGMSGFERLVVLKKILPEYAHHDEFVQMFLNEARIAATLHHTNIVQVHSIGEERGQVFFAMEFLHGEDLSRVLSRANQIGRPPQLEAVLTIASAVCAGLHYAHERCGPDGASLGIVHRDVSPHNVFVTYDGNIKLLDFGIAKASTSFGKTRTGVLKGKVAYMSPEQAYSQPVDRRSDIFCMGILLWELSTGRRLYRRRSELETLKALVDADAPKPSTVVSGYPPELEAIVMKCLCREPAGRYATCEELSVELESFAKTQSLQVSPLIATRMMRSLFKSEIAAFEAAVKSGGNLVDQVVARMEATAKKSSIDDWDSNVASVIVDIGSDPDKTSLTAPPNGTATVLVDPEAEATAVEPTPLHPVERTEVQVHAVEERTIPAEPIALPANVQPVIVTAPVERPSARLPGMPPARPSSPHPIAVPPVISEMPLASPVIQRPDSTEPGRRDWTGPPGHAAPALDIAPNRNRWPIIGGVAAVVIVAAIVIAKSGGSGGGDKPADPDPVANTAIDPPQPPESKLGGVQVPTRPSEPETEPNTAKPESKPDPKREPAKPARPAPKPQPRPDAKRPEPRKPAIAPRAPRPEPEIKKPVPKKVEPKKPEPKKPTAKDLDALPL